MQSTIKELSLHTKELLDMVQRGEEVIIMFRGKPYAKLVPFKESRNNTEKPDELFGIWENRAEMTNVNSYVREIRKGRYLWWGLKNLSHSIYQIQVILIRYREKFMAAMSNTKFKTVDEYLSALPPNVKKLLLDLRKAIKQAAPEAEEVISYNMPAYKFHGILVYYMAHKAHIGFYPGSSVISGIFKNDLTGYKTSKGTIQFPFDKAIPLLLVKKIVKFRIKQNMERAKTKLKKKR